MDRATGVRHRRRAASRTPGRGRFLVKVGGRPGIPVQVTLTSVEQAASDTNTRWHTASRVGPLADVIDDVALQDGLPGLPERDIPLTVRVPSGALR